MRRPASELNATADCLDVIKEFERLYLKAYICPAGIPTIGWGHTAGVSMGDTCTVAQAETYLRIDVTDAEQAVDNRVKVPLLQREFDALTSFVFNLRRDRWNEKHCSLLRLLNRGDYAAPAAENRGFQAWRMGGGKVLRGLERRRKAERALYLGEDFRKFFSE